MNSEQLPTRLFLGADRRRAVGLLLQKMPLEEGVSEEAEVAALRQWDRIQRLAMGLVPDELMRFDDEGLLRRLFPEDDVRLFAPAKVRFHCGCSRRRIEGVLRMMGRDEVDAAVREEGSLTVSCDFCGAGYIFDAQDVEDVFSVAAAAATEGAEDGSDGGAGGAGGSGGSSGGGTKGRGGAPGGDVTLH